MSDARALLAKVLPSQIILKSQADKKAESKGGGLGWFGGGGSTSKYEEAAELYTQAATAFRLQKLSHLRLVAFC